MSKDPNTMEAFVVDEVGMKESHPGSNAENQINHEEARKKAMEMRVEMASKYCKPHNIKSRVVKTEDLERVMKDYELMVGMCYAGRGEYNNAAAIAHSQIEEKDPLRFYVRYYSEVGRTSLIVNPVILNTKGDLERRLEGCLSFPDEPMINVSRFTKIKVTFKTIAHKVDKDGNRDGELYLTPWKTEYVSGWEARVIQHEVCHLNGHNIYDPGYSAGLCEGGVDKSVYKGVI